MKNKNYTNVYSSRGKSPSLRGTKNSATGLTLWSILGTWVIVFALSLFTYQAKATTCGGATVLAYQNYTAVSVTCGGTNDITSANSTTCGSGSYKGGLEALYTFTALASGSATVSYSGQTWTGITVYAGCPTSGGTCIGSVASSASSKSLNITITNGVQYYVMFDTWPTPNSPCPGTFNLTVPAVATPCTGTPNPGNTLSSVANSCSGTSFNLSLQNATTGTGVSYQWQSSPDGSSWTNFGTDAATQSVTQSSATYYQCIVTCAGSPGTSNPILVGVNNFYNCYCAASSTYSADTKIDSVQLGSLYVGTAASACETYTNNTAVPAPLLYINSPQTMRVRNGSCSGYHYGAFVHVYMDLDHDGAFNETNEKVAAYGLTTGLNTVPTFNFTIPSGTTTGLTGMRVIIREDVAPSSCGTFSYGEVEDYLVDIQNEPACIDPPTAGTALSTVSQFCSGGSVNIVLSLNGNTTGAGQTYQWQESPDGSTWSNIGGATSASFNYNGLTATSYFQCLVTCGASTVPSSSVFVEAVDPPAAGDISGPASVYANQVAVYTSSGENGALQWQARLLPSGTFANVSGATNNPQNIFYSAVGTYEIQLVTSIPGCTNAISNVVTTVVTIQNDNVCNATPVNIGVNGPFTNNGATVEPGEAQAPTTACNGNNSWCPAPSGTISNTVWFTFTVPTGGSGRYGFAVPGWDSQVAVWKASACGDLTSALGTLWAANDDSASSPFNAYARGFCLLEGETVYIQVDGYLTGVNNAFALRIDDFGPADASFSGLPSTICENAASVSLTGTVAGGTFSGPGVTGSSFDPAAAGAGVHTITYTLGGLDTCYSTSQSVTVETPVYTYYADADGDTYGNEGASILSCETSAPVGYTLDLSDCNDANPSINPAASESCNSIDDDCDGLTDEDFDLDGDTYTTCGGDCDDNNASVYPGAAEVCNNIDDDCNTLVDDGLTFVTYYADADGDTYGDASSTVSTCNGAPVGYVSDNTDCDDNNAAVNPAATEVCNSIDDDCDGLTDENILVAGAISGPAVQCLPVATGSATFSIAPVADATTYTWSVPAGMVIVTGQGTTSIFVSWSPAAISAGVIGNLSVVPSNLCGAGVASSVLVDINYTKPVMPNSISGPVKVCPGDVVTYSTSLVARSTSFVWTLPTGMSIVGGAGTNVISVSVSGAYTGGVISVSAANSCGVGAARNRALSLNVPPASASISGQASGVCGSLGVVYSCANVVGATSYNWSVPAGASIVSGNGTNTITVDFTGSYGGGNISVQSANGCGNGGTRNLSVTGAPGLPGVITGDQSICPGQANVPYSVATVAGASTYNWTVPGIATIASGQGTKDIFVNWGTNPTVGQSVTVSATNGCGTGAIRSLNGIAIDLGNCIRVGETGAATALNVYPNPATDLATIVFNGTEGADFNLNMVDIAGRVVMTERGTAVAGMNQRNVVVSEMASGVYFINIQINGVSEQIRVMID